LALFPSLYYYLYYISNFFFKKLDVSSNRKIYTNILEEDFLKEFDIANESRNTFVIQNRNPMIFSSDKKMDNLIELSELSNESG